MKKNITKILAASILALATQNFNAQKVVVNREVETTQ